MKLHTALKLKNRLAGELNRLQTILARENSRRSDNVSKVEAAEIAGQIQEVRTRLIDIKSAIATANVGIYPMLAEMEELKSAITFLNNLPCREGPEREMLGYGAAATTVEHQWTAYLNQEQKDARVKEHQTRIDALQDSVDLYNSSTEV